MTQISSVIKAFYNSNSRMNKRLGRFSMLLMFILAFLPFLSWIVLYSIYSHTMEFKLFEDLMIYGLLYWITPLAGNAEDKVIYEGLRESALSNMSTGLLVKIIIAAVVPVLICLAIVVIYVRLCAGTSKLYNFLCFGDKDYQKFLRLSDTYRLINIIEKVCPDYLSDSAFSNSEPENMAISSEMDAQNNNEMTSRSGEDNSVNREEEIKKHIALIERVESKKNCGKYEKAFRLLDKELPPKPISKKGSPE